VAVDEEAHGFGSSGVGLDRDAAVLRDAECGPGDSGVGRAQVGGRRLGLDPIRKRHAGDRNADRRVPAAASISSADASLGPSLTVTPRELSRRLNVDGSATDMRNDYSAGIWVFC